MQNEKNKYTLHPALLGYMHPLMRPGTKVPENDLKPYVINKEGVLQTPSGKEVIRSALPTAPKEVKYKVRVNGRDLIGATVAIFQKQIVITSAGSRTVAPTPAKSHEKAAKK